MATKKLISKIYIYFKIWWIPIVSFLLPFCIFLLGNILRNDTIIDISLILFLLNILGSLFSSMIQILLKKWYYIFPQIGISILVYLLLSFIFIFSPPDYYGSNKKIPDNIKIDEPLNTQPTIAELNANDLVISSSIQPGMYTYYTSKKLTELGELYIKVYEITSNDRLSEERIKLSSKVKITDLKPQIHSGDFTIYEGSWGDKYAARIELWFDPTNKNNDYKITERNYIVEGWMR